MAKASRQNLGPNPYAHRSPYRERPSCGTYETRIRPGLDSRAQVGRG
jgi:hypothetical protein